MWTMSKTKPVAASSVFAQNTKHNQHSIPAVTETMQSGGLDPQKPGDTTTIPAAMMFCHTSFFLFLEMEQ